MVVTETHNSATPHAGFGLGNVLHEFQEGEAILTFFIIRNPIEEALNMLVIWFRF